jgi:hypothetical protein
MIAAAGGIFPPAAGSAMLCAKFGRPSGDIAATIACALPIARVRGKRLGAKLEKDILGPVPARRAHSGGQNM